MSSTNKQISSRTLWRGITFDSTGAGVTAAADNAVIDGGSANGTPTTSRTESAAVFVFRIDCDVLEKPFAELSVSTNCSLLNGGWHGDIRVNQTAAQTSTSIGSYGSSFASRMWSLGSNHQVVATAGASIAIVCPCLMGVTLQGLNVNEQAVGTQPEQTGQLYYNVLSTNISTTISAPMFALTNVAPSRKGIGLVNVMCGGPNATSVSGPTYKLHGDGALVDMENLILQGIGYDHPLCSNAGDGRLNWGYSDQYFQRINMRASISGSAPRNYNNKGADFGAPETATTSATPATLYSAGTGYYRGQAVHNAPVVSTITHVGTTATVTTATAHSLSSGNSVTVIGAAPTAYNGTFTVTVLSTTQFTYTAGSTPATDATNVGLLNTPTTRIWQSVTGTRASPNTGNALTDTANWVQAPANADLTTVFAQQPLRQGNASNRYHVNCYGNVTTGTFDFTTVTGPATPLGYKWGPEEQTDATYANFYTTAGSNYDPKITGPLVNRIPAGRAFSPIDLLGRARRNDGTGAAGAYERTDPVLVASFFNRRTFVGARVGL